MGIPWQTSLGIVFISGVLFLLLSLVGFREKIINAIPETLRLSVPVGIGLLITFIGLKNMGLIVGHETTFIAFGHLTRTVLISLAGLMVIIILDLYKVKGSILIGVSLIYLIGLITGDIEAPQKIISTPPSIEPIAFQLDITGALEVSFAGVIFSFLYVDLFDSVGTILGCAHEANMIDKEGKVKDAKKILTSDASATIIGSLMGTSTITTYIESASGISAGARTGLSSMITAFLFLFAPVFAPLIGSFPGYATAPALVIIGLYMFKIIYKIRFDVLIIGIPAFLTIVMMPFTGSISTGLSFGFLSYILLMIIRGKAGEMPLTLWVIGLMTLFNFLV
jgi:AGZA family xanthine/uracil permease-like MFS transporter